MSLFVNIFKFFLLLILLFPWEYLNLSFDSKETRQKNVGKNSTFDNNGLVEPLRYIKIYANNALN